MIGTVAGNYKIVEEIGVGGMGKVYRGIDLTLDRDVAIKALRPELMTKDQIVNRFRNEAMTLAKLNHPHIATLYSFFRHEDVFLMVLEFVRGERLDRRMTRFGLLAPDDAIRIFSQVLQAIAFAHKRGIIHRDLKPNNVMITEAEEVKVMDFGIARVVGTERMTQEGLLVGTIEYMAPEQIRGHDPSPQTDIYSLGIMLYEMMTGRLPFSCKSQYEMMRAHIELSPLPPTQFVPDIEPQIEEAMLKALAKDPADRYASVEDFHAALLGVDPSTFHERPLRQTVQARTLDPAMRSLASDQLSSGARRTPSTPGSSATPATPATPASGAQSMPASGQHATPASQSGASQAGEVAPRPFYTRPLVLGGAAAALLLIVLAAVFALRPETKKDPTPTPAPAPKYPVDVVRIQGGAFVMGREVAPQQSGSEDPDWAANEWPAHQMRVLSFDIDRYEVTNEEYALFVKETGAEPPTDWKGEQQPPAGQERWPVHNVSQVEAQLFATWRSKRDGAIYRLPSEAEWEYAASGGRRQRYPWGDEWVAGRANVENRGPQPVGSYKDGASPSGVQDMLGNVGEWTSSFAQVYPGNQYQLNDKDRGSVVVRGGSYISKPTGVTPIRITSRGWIPPSERKENIGFRLVREITKN